MTIREGRWDCQYCGTKGILGRHQACPVCAQSRPAGTKFYLPAGTEAVTDAEQLGYAQRGPDWICEYCSSSNGAERTSCQSCHAERSGTAAVQKVVTYQPGEAPQSGDMSFAESAAGRPQASTLSEIGESDSLLDIATWDDRLARLPRRLFLFGGLALLLVCGLLVTTVGRQFFDREIPVQVAGYEWERSIEVEAYRTVTEEDWSLPAGGRLLSQREEIHHYNQVLAGYETRTREVPEQVYVGERTFICGVRDLGNGFFEDITCSEPMYETRFRTESYQEPIYNDVPVFQTKFTYEIDKWVVDRTETADGRNREPYWPRLDLEENEREGARSERYIAIFQDDEGQRYRLDFPFGRWSQFGEGEEHTLKINASGEAVEFVN